MSFLQGASGRPWNPMPLQEEFAIQRRAIALRQKGLLPPIYVQARPGWTVYTLDGVHMNIFRLKGLVERLEAEQQEKIPRKPPQSALLEYVAHPLRMRGR